MYQLEIQLKSGPLIRVRSEKKIEASQSWTKIKTGNPVVATEKHWLKISWKDRNTGETRNWLFDMDDVEAFETKVGEEVLK